MKVSSFSKVKKLTDIPNIGSAMVRDLKTLGITKPQDLKGKDAFLLYKKLCKLTGIRQDPCVLDTYLAITDFTKGAPARPWFWYTKERKERYKNI